MANAEIPVAFDDIVAAKERLAAYLHKTPVFTSATADELSGRKVFFKAEFLQKTGSFKARGALNATLLAKERNPSLNGTVTHSSGNHGQGVAWAAKCVGVPSYVVVPSMAPASKKIAIQGYGAHLVECGASPNDRVTVCEKVQKEKDLEFFPPYDHPHVIAGQGTIALEFLEQVPELDAILVPTSGGGMGSGIAIAAKHIKPELKVFLVTPKGKMLEECLQSGERLWPQPPQYLNTIADAIRLQQLGHITFPILTQLAEKTVFDMSDEEMVAGMRFAMQRMKLVVEVAAGAGVAAALSDKMKAMDKGMTNIGVILCGGNVDIDQLPW